MYVESSPCRMPWCVACCFRIVAAAPISPQSVRRCMLFIRMVGVIKIINIGAGKVLTEMGLLSGPGESFVRMGLRMKKSTDRVCLMLSGFLIPSCME